MFPVLLVAVNEFPRSAESSLSCKCEVIYLTIGSTCRDRSRSSSPRPGSALPPGSPVVSPGGVKPDTASASVPDASPRVPMKRPDGALHRYVAPDVRPVQNDVRRSASAAGDAPQTTPPVLSPRQTTPVPSPKTSTTLGPLDKVSNDGVSF